jgi:hypothetical protein
LTSPFSLQLGSAGSATSWGRSHTDSGLKNSQDKTDSLKNTHDEKEAQALNNKQLAQPELRAARRLIGQQSALVRLRCLTFLPPESENRTHA